MGMMLGIVRLLGEDSTTDQSLPDGRGFREATPKNIEGILTRERLDPNQLQQTRRMDVRPGSPIQGTCEDRTIRINGTS